ncbi:putative phosphatase NT01CX [Clostridium pasteurianum DSM 525 = ATCC 6013]|uniref:Hydrolase ycdX n=1 Tax=Clostridium pasteurianum DSM 525 = ATCC 6013 TaxID=1262449 RepID=A0A0H3J9Y0_CLOPA|nr:phosphatase [Clostridium pasteurianum]AJA48075.1 putative phosphatase NT01CX [Clostridium pasteurianum DSM 525 = ATCC 6013]AJA52063.1 putative phosphatase NT01CX [Clostridium pasteurianum DSM 525 = ATCC 6013]AOZ75347.1 hydrolase [Clostridium pasteurianum DSM 525 = ATCC 6013]AOZ79142.1 hydrolase [Clostridium pasteurianum]ELP60772.1 hydrolase [Clostridium pasteurianum DSM 525 = ATCC 6013]
MKYPIDIHTHTVASGHAYTTLLENAKYASEIGLKILGTTDHAPSMPDAPHEWYFGNFKALPREIYGVTMLYGCEANIVDYDGNIDLPLQRQEQIDIMIASIHDPVMKPVDDPDLNTKAFLNAMNNPNVHIIGHSGNPAFPIHAEELVKKAKEKNVLIEINNSSFIRSRIGSEKTCSKIARLCKENNVKIILNSDAHSCFSIGNFDAALKILKDIDMPEELIINRSPSELLSFLKKKGKSIENR